MVLNISPTTEKELLSIIQKEFPLEKRPFLKIGERLNIKEEEVIKYLEYLKKKRILRQISAIFNPWFFGHRSSLFAFKVPPEKLDKAISIINKHPGISHNYLRNHDYNLWFILVSLPEKDPLDEADKLAKLCEVEDYLYLPALRTFKISAVFGDKISDFDKEEIIDIETTVEANKNITEKDKILVKILQEPLPLVKTPFKEIAKFLGIKEEDLFLWIREMKEKGALRRFGALLKHNKLGFKVNVMVAWETKRDKIDFLIEKLSKELLITHCYERKTYPNWKYNLYTMCHFKEEKEKEKILLLAQKYSIKNFIMLETVKELKKIRLKLFYELE
ncbi:putative transcriptional regulator, AsnC family [Thermodesulfobacterium geofontis OPF15]|uniref:siroheme decarboxylase n=1 Tax=Thermodesulfobacterium geofontis (strain OPF15) TaxID=795359 RepID=F8C5C7_THEGP|nr:Lrp/AsnC family transcriptional regulator [Thermodesulfobacterium geofontis]AEH22899.1 putative transcriptional regulator, AsnC family [Thermodesulfobacterium geofontis OPF15]